MEVFWFEVFEPAIPHNKKSILWNNCPSWGKVQIKFVYHEKKKLREWIPLVGKGENLNFIFITCSTFVKFLKRISFYFIHCSTFLKLFGLFHSTTCGLAQCICNQPTKSMQIHFLPHSHGERIAIHNVIRNVFAFIARKVGFHFWVDTCFLVDLLPIFTLARQYHTHLKCSPHFC